MGSGYEGLSRIYSGGWFYSISAQYIGEILLSGGISRRVMVLMILSVVAFIVSAIAGSQSPEDLKASLYRAFEDSVREIEGIINSSRGSPIQLAVLPLLIFGNNLLVSLVMLALFPTIIGPWIFISYQGFVTGAVVGYGGVDEGIREIASLIPGCRIDQGFIPIAKLVLILPHGVFEIPGVGVFVASSTRLSIALIGYILWRLGKRPSSPIFLDSVREILMPLLIGVLLLIVAAFIESFVTPVIGFIVIVALCTR